ncbi:MAG: 16S rRNA (cytidine(1402)-2'-O)-methyltransferase [Synergistaceae bacterium]|jgi:16S rRNA (cytidine1402-2'-O)-methyltransferase|nr:16S rRNA (cytidine(1402)-2'-O)-methyltransferase [Synergistaceae bacterium]
MPLLVVPTPVGNLEDMTLRGLRALREADVIACEDTRRTLKLLNHFGVRKPLISCHRHNERARIDDLMSRLELGENVALVSDAGTPGISDPGVEVIRAAIDRGLPVDVLPGPNALLPALLLSGLACGRFFFAGFIDGGDSERREILAGLSKIPAALVFYVAPHGLPGQLDLFASALGDRDAALAREISKVHQEVIRGTLGGIALMSREREIRGELVLVVAGSDDEGEDSPGEAETAKWLALARGMQELGIFDREIANMLSASYGIPRNTIKTALLKFKTETGGSG